MSQDAVEVAMPEPEIDREASTHVGIEPAILYLGTPVVLVSTCNENGTANLSPMSSAWWLGWSCMLGFDASSKTVANLQRTGQCVLNLPSAGQATNVDRLARLTGSDPMPLHKQRMGYRFVEDKFGVAQLTPQASEVVEPPRVRECPLQLEAELQEVRPFATQDPRMLIPTVCMEVRVLRVHAAPDLLCDVFENRIDPLRWNPLLMSFLRFFERGGEVHPSRLAELPQEAWGARRPQPRARAAS
jgi:flavin reductase (DIM6/NTAB) family NADH-FMN oxidoreductase RutF